MVTGGIGSSDSIYTATNVQAGNNLLASNDVISASRTRTQSTVDSTSTTTGALIVSGGAGIAKKLWAASAQTTGDITAGGDVTVNGAINWASIARPVATRLTAQTLSGASIQFTNIPSTVDTIEIYFYGFSANVTSFFPKIEIGTQNLAGYQTTDYAATAWRDGVTDDSTAYIPMFPASTLSGASDNFSGMLRIRYVYGNNISGYYYVFEGSCRLNAAANRGACVVGSLFTAGSLSNDTFIDRIRISASAGTLDGGYVNVLYY